MNKNFLWFCSLVFLFLNSCVLDSDQEKVEVENNSWSTTSIVASEVVDYNLEGSPLFNNPELALGFPKGNGLNSGSLDVVSLGVNELGEGGWIILKFPQKIINGPGTDFKIFENSFSINENEFFIEAAKIYLSEDNAIWYEFPSQVNSEYSNKNLNYYLGLAGVNPVYSNVLDSDSPKPENDDSGGDFFDLEQMTSPIKENGFKYLKIVDAGKGIADPGNEDPYNNGFDLDAVVGINYEEK